MDWPKSQLWFRPEEAELFTARGQKEETWDPTEPIRVLAKLMLLSALYR